MNPEINDSGPPPMSTRERVWQALVGCVAYARDPAQRDATSSLLADECLERVVEAITGDRYADPWGDE